MKFKKYMHLERFGHREVKGINLGTCHIFPKLDGTNSSLWLDDNEEATLENAVASRLRAGSRTRTLTLVADNAGFYCWAITQPNLIRYLEDHPKHRLYGEWLVPHTLKTYRADAWKRFWIFDVSVEGKQFEKCVPYEEYAPELEKYGLDYITPICKVENPSEEWLYGFLDRANFLVEDGKGHGEGIVIKNYNFSSPDGSQTWAKIVRQEFKEQNVKAFGINNITLTDPVEARIVDKFLTESMIDKIYAKIVVENGGWDSKCIPRLLETCFYDLIMEEMWSILKEFKVPTVNFRSMKMYTTQKIKLVKKDLF